MYHGHSEFAARRGTPVAYYCDNGTNFDGAKNELERALKEVDNNALEAKFSTSTTAWHFNPPASPPQLGGSWERKLQGFA